MKKITIFLMLLSMISQISGFIRELTLSYLFGASSISDAYLISLTIPMVIFSFIGQALTTSYIPIFSKLYNDRDNSKSINFTNNLINILLLVCTLVILLGITFSSEIVKFFASGFDSPTLELTIKFTVISLFGIYSMVLVNILSGFLQYRNNYHSPAMIGLAMNIILIISIYVSSIYNNPIILSFGSLVAMLTQAIILLPAAYKKGFRYRFYIDIKDENLLQILKLSIPVIMGVAVNEINVLVDRTLASQISVGGISALSYANKLNGFIYGIFVFSVASVLYPTIIKKVKENDNKGFIKSLTDAINAVNFLVVPATIGIMFFSKEIIAILFGRGAFDSEDIVLTATALFFYSIGIIGVSQRLIISRAFYALEDTKTPMINASLGVIINVVLNIILSRHLGIGGLALATSIASIFTTVLMFITLRKKIGIFSIKKISISFLKILLASLIMGLFAKLSFAYLIITFSQNTSLLISIFIGAIFYILIAYFTKIEEIDVIVGTIKKKLFKEVS